MAFDIAKKITFVLGLTGDDKVRSGVKGVTDQISATDKAVSTAKMAFAGLMGAISVGALTAWIKSGIDAADAAHQIAQKTGLATKDVAGLQLAFKLGVGSADGMTGSMAKMSKSIVDGSGAYKLLGVNVKNADGSFRSTKDVLYDTADAFAGIKDGAAKTALAVEIFGKTGAEMIPMLNGGSAAMREMEEVAEKLGLTISKEVGAQADEFNDTMDKMSMIGQGMSLQIAGKLLPALVNLAQGFFETATQSDYLKRVAAALGEGLSVVTKVLGTLGYSALEIISTLVKGAGALAGVIDNVIRGNFSAALAVGKEALDDIGNDWNKAGAKVVDLWTNTAAATVKATSDIDKAQRDLTTSTKDLEAASKAAAAAKEKEAEAYLTFKGTIADLILKQQEELASGEKLTAADKLAVEAKKRYAGAELETALAMIAVAAEQEKAIDLRKREAVATGEAVKARTDALKGLDSETAKLIEQIDQQRAHNETLATGVDRTQELAIARLRDAAAAAERQAIVALDKNLDEEAYNGYMRQAQALRDLADARETGIGMEAAKKASEEWTKVSDQIGQGLTDSLYRAFESGKDFFSTLWSGIKNTFKTTVLRLVVDATMNPVNALLGAALNGTPLAPGNGVAQLAGNNWLSSGLNMLSSGSSGMMNTVAGWMGLGTSAGVGIGTSMVGGTIMTPAAIEAMLAGSTAGAAGTAAAGVASGVTGGSAAAAGGSGLLGTLGSAAPYLAAAYAIYKAFEYTPTHHKGSVVTVDALGARTGGADPSRILDNFDQGTDDALKTLAGGSVSLLNLLSTTFGGAGGFAAATKFAADGKDASFGAFSLSRAGATVGEISPSGGHDARMYSSDAKAAFEAFGGDVGRVVRSAIDTIDLPQWASDALAALGDDPGIDKLTQAATAIAQTRQQLTGLGEALTPMGGIFARIATLGDEAKLSLAGMVGGLDQLVAKSQSFVQAYYSESEQASIAARSILEQVQRAGVSGDTYDMIAGLGSRSEFRGLFDSIDLSTDFGLKMAGLGLNLGTQFAQIADYLDTNDLTLGGLASSGVDPAVLALLNSATEAAASDAADVAADAATTTAEAATETATATKATAEAVSASTDLLREIVESIQADMTANADALGLVIAKLASIDARVHNIETVVALAAVAPAES